MDYEITTAVYSAQSNASAIGEGVSRDVERIHGTVKPLVNKNSIVETISLAVAYWPDRNQIESYAEIIRTSTVPWLVPGGER